MAYIAENQSKKNAIRPELKKWVWAVRKNLYFYQTKNPVATQKNKLKTTDVMKLKVQNIPAFFFYGMAACAFSAILIGAKHHSFILLSCLYLGFVAQKSN